uniref:Centriolar and ciliogenesis-associated protein HYLS1 C-terminal domain-containing protein n=1 Tax=Arion vulgaris TaxID=1028688 RepID=A0A0B6Y8Z5_9EUPU
MDVDFTDGEIREELARLGYKDVPEDKLADFKKDLMRLIHSERSKNSSFNSSNEGSKPEVKDFSPTPELDPVFAARNFSNHGNQWLRNNYKEDWHYQGEEMQPSIAQSKRDHSRNATVSDSYTHPSVPVAIVTDGKDYVTNKQNNYSSGNYSDSDADSVARYVKRKTVRKGTNGNKVVDESFSTTDSIDNSGLYDVYEKIKRLAMRDCECGKTRPTSAESEPPYRIKGVNRNPSVMMTRKEPPHTRNLVRTKPFQRHQMYQRAWKLQPPIGEDFRHGVCRDVHSKLLKKEEVKLSHKVFVPNAYVVPSEKPRYELRWAVRKSNQNYEIPQCGFFHEI